MSREVLHLPEPARTLLNTTFETLDSTLVEIVPEGQGWHLGGGTVLAARWAHRKSTDVDIFLPANSGIAALDPRWNPQFTNAMNALGASRVERQASAWQQRMAGKQRKPSYPAGNSRWD